MIKNYISSDLFHHFLLNHYMYNLLFITHFLQSLHMSAILRFMLNARRCNVPLTPHHPLLLIVECCTRNCLSLSYICISEISRRPPVDGPRPAAVTTHRCFEWILSYAVSALGSGSQPVRFLLNITGFTISYCSRTFTFIHARHFKSIL